MGWSDGWGGGEAYSFVGGLVGHFTVDHASLSRLSTVSAATGDASIIFGRPVMKMPATFSGVQYVFFPCIGPFLTPSDSASRKRPFSTGLFFDWILLVVLFVVNRVGFTVFCALPRGGWCEEVLLYGSRKSVGSSVLRAFFASNVCFARDELSLKGVGGVGLSRKPPKLRSWRSTQPRGVKATAGVPVVGKMAPISRAAAVV